MLERLHSWIAPNESPEGPSDGGCRKELYTHRHNWCDRDVWHCEREAEEAAETAAVQFNNIVIIIIAYAWESSDSVNDDDHTTA